MKKLLTALLILLLALPVSTPAEEAGKRPEVFTSGDYRYVLTEEGSAQITGYTGAAGALEIPAELDGHAVTSVRKYAFAYCDSLTSVTVPEGVTDIGDNAFSQCGGLTSLTIPDSVTGIGANPFAGCGRLREIVVSGEHPSLAVVDGALFSRPDSRLVCVPCTLTAGTYAVPEGTAIIGASAFCGCYDLTSVTVPDSVTAVGDYAFEDCTGLASVTLPDTVTAVGEGAFIHCTALTSIALPEGVTAIGSLAFSRCGSLASVTLPEGVTSIGDGAFSGCSALTSVTLPDSVTDLGANPFEDCAALREIAVSEDHPCLAVVDGALINRPDMRLVCVLRALTAETYAIPREIRIIGDRVFSNCGGLASVTIPDGVTAVGARAFDCCYGLTSVTVPDSVTAIGEDAFGGCPDLTLTVGRGSFAEQYCADNGLQYVCADA